MKIKITLLFILVGYYINAQNMKLDSLSTKICYELPKNIENEISNFLKNDSLNTLAYKYYCCLSEVEDTLTLIITSYNYKLNPKICCLIEVTNRFLKLNSKLIPIIFRSDFLLSNIINTYTTYNNIPVLESVTFTGGGFFIKFLYSVGAIQGKILEIGNVR